MNNTIKNTKKGILMVAMIAASLSFANEGTPFFTVKNNAKTSSLTLTLVKRGNQLSIKNTDGTILYNEMIQKTGVYTKGFDLTDLPNGNYYFELDSDVEIKIIPFTVESNRIVYKKQMEKAFFKPIIRIKDDLVYVSQLSLNNEALKIDIYFESANGSELVLCETIKKTKNERIYKLTGLKNGNYTFVFNTEGRVFRKRIN